MHVHVMSCNIAVLENLRVKALLDEVATRRLTKQDKQINITIDHSSQHDRDSFYYTI